MYTQTFEGQANFNLFERNNYVIIKATMDKTSDSFITYSRMDILLANDPLGAV